MSRLTNEDLREGVCVDRGYVETQCFEGSGENVREQITSEGEVWQGSGVKKLRHGHGLEICSEEFFA